MMRQYELVERVQKYDPTANEALLNRAYVYAMQAHGHQKRASGDPFFSHPLEVAAILTELKLDDATIAAALLHDVIEDTDVTRAEIDQKFGKEIGALVEGLTKIKRLDLVTKKAEQAENFRKLLVAISSDIRVLLIKLADRLHNIRALGIVHSAWRAVPGRFKDYVSTPKQNNYQSIHTTVVGPRHQWVELQIRTRDMDQIAEYGVAAHALYKDGVHPGEHGAQPNGSGLAQQKENPYIW